MNTFEMTLRDSTRSSVTLRDLVAIGFRHKRLAVICFVGIMLGTGVALISNPYRASTEFLVERERLDPIVTSEQNPMVARQPEVSEEDINSEIQILRSEDVLRQVVLTCGLDKRKSLSEYIFGPASRDKKIAKAIEALEGHLTIAPVNKSHVIDVTYTSTDPKMAARVLQALGDAYLQEHKTVFTPPGQVEFFNQEAERYKKELADAEEQIKKFSTEQNGVAPHVSRDITLQKLSDFQSSLQQTKADLATVDQRINSLEKQAQTTPERLTTSSWKQDDYQVLQGLKNTLMTLQLKRSEYLMKYQPDYPLVKEVDKEISETQASITAEESKPIKQETTDRNPTYAWINEELAKAKAEHSGLQAKLVATQATVETYESEARDLQQKGLVEQDLYRNMKADEDNYLLYLQKREQARMTEALNASHIANVSVAEQPVVPSMPYNSPSLIVLIGTLVAAMVTVGAIFTQEYLDPSFRTPSEVATVLNVPLLAAVPHQLEGFHANENRNGDGYRQNGGTGAHSLSDESVTAADA